MKKQRLPHGEMAYYESGKGRPVVFGHSFLWDHAMWQPQLAAFSTQYRCIAPDLWSHGQSDPLPEKTNTIENLADHYWQFTQALGVSECALIGLSVGGMWAVHYALTHPNAVKVLVLMDTFVGAEPEASQKVYFGMMDKLEADNAFTPALADTVAPYFFSPVTTKENPALVSAFIQSLLNTPSNHILGKVNLGRAIFSRTDLLARLSQIQVPTLIVVGEDDLPRPPGEAQAMAKCLPNAELAIIPKAGHICTLEQPTIVNEVLQTFLKKHYD